jgi:glutaredoxin 3
VRVVILEKLGIKGTQNRSILLVLESNFLPMLTLYYRPTCAFCRQVTAVIGRMELEVEMKDITDTAYEAELMELGGKVQVPYLVDTEAGVALYESDDIVTHLQKTYGQPASAPSKVRVHISDNACVACEG